ncbi:MAG: MurT ligase domain-containing protein [Bacillota bacterium]|nr:MurT ligase domain-containing protein [Bacillota bacterium]
MSRSRIKITVWVRLVLALLAARLVAFGCRLFGHPGTSLPGVVALKIFPGLVQFLVPGYERVLAVTGTNGKTTTANLLAHTLRRAGFTVAHNAEGANMLPGVATALIRDCTRLGRPRSRVALLEVDEGSVAKVFAAARPELVIVTNYFRDQLDRYWELERTTALLRSAVAGLPGVTLILNGDDPLVASVGRGHPRTCYFGVLRDTAPAGAVPSGTVSPGAAPSVAALPGATSAGGSLPGVSAGAASPGSTSPGAAPPAAPAGAAPSGGIPDQVAGIVLKGSGETREGRFCLCCGTALVYHYYHYGQLGDYFCPDCGFHRPVLDFAAFDVNAGDALRFSLRFSLSGPGSSEPGLLSRGFNRSGLNSGLSGLQPPAGGSRTPEPCRNLFLEAPLRGFYNVYNVLGAAAAALTLGIPAGCLKTALLDYTPALGRMEEFIFQGRPCTLALIKNPAGVDEVLKTILEGRTEKALVIAINDLAADGRDVSWLWDADFARLAGARIKKIICAGRRAADLAVCLKYAGIDPGRLALAPERAASLKILAQQAAEGVEELYVLATYTNLFPYAGLLRRWGKVVERGAAQSMPSLS